MKKFFTVVPSQVTDEIRKYHYTAVGNDKLNMERETSFPILTAIHGYVEPEEAFEVVVLMMDTEKGCYNFKLFEQELNEICTEKGIATASLTKIYVQPGDAVFGHIETFQKLIAHVAEGDELFWCLTFGTKPLSMAIKIAVQYAYLFIRNTGVGCVAYIDVDHPNKDKSSHKSYVYDQTALLHLDEIVRTLAAMGVKNPPQFIKRRIPFNHPYYNLKALLIASPGVDTIE